MRAAAIALALFPVVLGVGRYWPAYVAPGEGIWHQYRSISLYPSDLVVAVAVGAWLSARAAGARFARPGLALGPVIGLGALALAAALSATSAAEIALAIGVAGQLALLALFCVAVIELIESEHRRTIIAGLCLAVLLQAIIAGWQAVTQSTAPAGALFNGWTVEFAAPDRGAIVAALPGVDRWLRAYGSFAHPNILGIFLALSLAVLLVADDAPPRWRTLALAAGAVALTLTFSRVAWLAVALAGAAWLVARYGRGAPAWLARTLRARPLVAVALAVGAGLAAARSARLDVTFEQGTFEARALYEAAAWSLVERGEAVGAGGIVLAQQRAFVGARLGEPAHNVLLLALAEMGPAGVLAWLVLFAALAALAWRRRHDAALRAGPLVGLAVMLPLLWFDHHLWTQPTGRALLVYTLAALVAVSGQARDGSDGRSPRRSARGGGNVPQAKGIFEIKGWDEKTYEELPNGGKLSEAKVTQRFTGDITGEGSVIWLMGYPTAKTARFVGMQRIVGAIGGRQGSFLVETIGEFDGTVAKARWSIVTDSGTDALAGISGEGAFEAPHGSKAEYRVDYELGPAGGERQRL